MQGQIHSKGFHPDIWDWLLGNICPNCKSEHCKSVALNYNKLCDWLMQQVDVKNIFPHGDLEEEVSM